MNARSRQTAIHACPAGARMRSYGGYAARVARRAFSFYAWRFS